MSKVTVKPTKRTKNPQKIPSAPNRGVVKRCLKSIVSPKGLSSSQLIDSVRHGLAYSELETLRDSLGIRMERLASHVGLSRATLQRRKMGDKSLSPVVSDRVVRLARLMGKAIEVLDGESNARHWMISPQYGLNGVTPLDYADTEVGAREVESLLGRIEHGIVA